MARITGRITDDYFAILCETCGEETTNEYLGGDPGVPHFRATCKYCMTAHEWRLSATHWSGLPCKADNQ